MSVDRSNYAIGLADDGYFVCDQPQCNVHNRKTDEQKADDADTALHNGTCARYYNERVDCDRVGELHLCGVETVVKPPTQLHIYGEHIEGYHCGKRWYPGMMWLNDYMLTPQIENSGSVMCRECVKGYIKAL